MLGPVLTPYGPPFTQPIRMSALKKKIEKMKKLMNITADFMQCYRYSDTSICCLFHFWNSDSTLPTSQLTRSAAPKWARVGCIGSSTLHLAWTPTSDRGLVVAALAHANRSSQRRVGSYSEFPRLLAINLSIAANRATRWRHI